MDLIEKVQDTIESTTKKIKNIDGKKALVIGGIGAGVLGIIVYLKNKSVSEQNSTIVAGNGAGDIPYTTQDSSGGLEINELIDEYNEALDSLATQYNTELTGIKSNYNQSLSDMESKYNDIITESEYYYNDKLSLLESDLTSANNQIELLSTQSKYTYDPNVDYASALKSLVAKGVSYDSDEATNLVISRAEKIADNNSLSKYSVTYDANVNYQKAINEAIARGENQSVIDTLNAQRNAKIDGENLSSTYSKNTSSTSSKTTTPSTTASKTASTNTTSSTTASKTTSTNTTSSTNNTSSSSDMNSRGLPRWIFGD